MCWRQPAFWTPMEPGGLIVGLPSTVSISISEDSDLGFPGNEFGRAVQVQVSTCLCSLGAECRTPSYIAW